MLFVHFVYYVNIYISILLTSCRYNPTRHCLVDHLCYNKCKDRMKKLTGREQIKAIAGVAALSFKIAPGAVMFKIGGAIFEAVLPLLTTYFAALTTTALVDAYAGNDAARSQVI